MQKQKKKKKTTGANGAVSPKTTDYSRKVFEPGKIYAEKSTYGIRGENGWFLEADLFSIEIVDREGDVMNVVVHENPHPANSFYCSTDHIQVNVARDKDGCEFTSAAGCVFFPKTEVSRKHVEKCEKKFFAYYKKWCDAHEE